MKNFSGASRPTLVWNPCCANHSPRCVPASAPKYTVSIIWWLDGLVLIVTADTLRKSASEPCFPIVFIPNDRREMTGFPTCNGDPYEDSCAPDVIAVSGPIEEWQVLGKTEGSISYVPIPYHRAVSLIEIRPRVDGCQALTYPWYHLQACPDRPGVYFMSACTSYYQIGWRDASGMVSSDKIFWTNLEPLVQYIFSMYCPPSDHFTRDPTIVCANPTTRGVASWDITHRNHTYNNCKIIYVPPACGRRTTVFECPSDTPDGCQTIIKEYYRDDSRRFEEETLLTKVHEDGTFPGVVRLLDQPDEVKSDGLVITTARQASADHQVSRRTKVRFVMASTGERWECAKSLKELLMAAFDLVEGTLFRFLYIRSGRADISRDGLCSSPCTSQRPEGYAP